MWHDRPQLSTVLTRVMRRYSLDVKLESALHRHPLFTSDLQEGVANLVVAHPSNLVVLQFFSDYAEWVWTAVGSDPVVLCLERGGQWVTSDR